MQIPVTNHTYILRTPAGSELTIQYHLEAAQHGPLTYFERYDVIGSNGSRVTLDAGQAALFAALVKTNADARRAMQ